MVVALVGLASTIVSILLTARVNTKVNRVGRDAAAARIQVENNHETNMREEGDDRHAENSSKLDTIIRDLSRLRDSVGRLWERTDNHTDQIHDLELTQDRARFAPPARHRGES